MITVSGQKRDHRGLTPGARRMIAAYISSETQRRNFGTALNENGELMSRVRRNLRGEQLAGGIAHHFNNILKMEPDNPLRAYVEYMVSSSEMAADLTKKLLAFSGQQRMRPAMTDLNETVRGSRRLLPLFVNKSIELRTKLTGRRLPVMIDVAAFEEVLVNLISNAVDAMPLGGKLTLATDRVEKGRTSKNGTVARAEYALLTISDTGIGMTRETKKQAFDPFFTTKEVGKGTGLGLSIAHGTVKQHAGSIDIESRPGRGTKVSLYLPIAKARDRRTGPARVIAGN